MKYIPLFLLFSLLTSCGPQPTYKPVAEADKQPTEVVTAVTQSSSIGDHIAAGVAGGVAAGVANAATHQAIEGYKARKHARAYSSGSTRFSSRGGRR